MRRKKVLLNFLVIVVLTILSFYWTFLIFHKEFDWEIVGVVLLFRIVASRLIFNDYAISWSKVTPKSFLLKEVVYITAFFGYLIVFYKKVNIYFLSSELFLYLISINTLMYSYYLIVNRKSKNKTVVIYGAGDAGTIVENEFRKSEYKVVYFIDDKEELQNRNIDGIPIISREKFLELGNKYDLLVIAMPSVDSHRVEGIYESLKSYFSQIKILPNLQEILRGNRELRKFLKDISVEDLLARRPVDLDRARIEQFVKNRKILVTGAGGSIGSEIVRQCIKYQAREIVLLDHSEFNLYRIHDEVQGLGIPVYPVLQTVTNIQLLKKTFLRFRPEIVIHAAAYKHVPLVEENVEEAILNNIFGTVNAINCAIEFGVEKFILISTDKAVKPTNVMGATKRVCELYAQNVDSSNTEIVAVRFGNVLGSSGSVVPKFKKLIEEGKNLTVTHKDVTRYFMLIPEACELVLQAGAIGKGGEIFILDMGEPVKIVDLAKKMIELSGRDDIGIEFVGLRPGEKLYEELLIDGTEEVTEYKSIFIAKPTKYKIDELKKDINALLEVENKISQLKKIVPEFQHRCFNS